MAVEFERGSINEFDAWYKDRRIDERTGGFRTFQVSDSADELITSFRHFRQEMRARTANYEKLEKLAAAQVISEKPDLPNVSSGESAGLVRRMARKLVQHTPDVHVVCEFADDSPKGIFVRHILLSKIIGADRYSNDMQQNLFASTKTSLTLGFDCVIPVLLQDAAGSWYVKYDTIHHNDVFPEPGATDVRQATEVFIRRYLTKGEILALIRDTPAGWDEAALRDLIVQHPKPPSRRRESTGQKDHQRKVIPEGYEIITWYSSSGQPFLTFSGQTNALLRIEENLHPLRWHPVFFLVLEKDHQQPLGQSQVELILGRQEFQDLMHNGAMKLWYRNINPSILGYGITNLVPNLSPGKFTPINNPNARIEPFEVNTQTLLQYNQISDSNHGAMINMVGAADQQMAAAAGGGMSATPQGVEAQEAMVDTTTNNYQKAIEAFFSQYCSYALTLYFQELKGTVKKVKPTAEARAALLAANFPEEEFNEKGEIEIDFADLAVEYFVTTVSGSLVELEDEKQMRILNELFIPLSQSLPAIAQAGNERLLQNAGAAMQFLVTTQIEMSGSNRARELKRLMETGKRQEDAPVDTDLEDQLGALEATIQGMESTATSLAALQAQMNALVEVQTAMLQKLGMDVEGSTSEQGIPTEETSPDLQIPIQ